MSHHISNPNQICRIEQYNKALSLIGQRKRSEKKLLPLVFSAAAFRIVKRKIKKQARLFSIDNKNGSTFCASSEHQSRRKLVVECEVLCSKSGNIV
ncbi:hypothetical protein T4B_1358 [Trichinella pseudospiralis]|uniref:Uncharacterized protein n=1 Tax=Trichinella pseudospiralis TaxID=6337 RepID=A0A0V1IFC8_TRIPS|nr:hypothetical protein T4B_1358 [Trichinella pseudospiralis]KRZ28285.1 hypothetical protein T4C_1250 [Trichinella pseudospiralis]